MDFGMIRVALKMLIGDRTKYVGLLLGITFTSFLVAFAASFFAGFMTRGFALISESPDVDVWVMNPAVDSTEHLINMSMGDLYRVKSVDGVRYAAPLSVTDADVTFPNGQFQKLRVIGVDDATLLGLPSPTNGVLKNAIRAPDAAFFNAGGTEGKLQFPARKEDRWTLTPDLNAPTRPMAAGDVILLNSHRVKIKGQARALPRYPPIPLLYMSYSNAENILPPERHRLTFILVVAQAGVSPAALARRIHEQTGLRARTSDEFKADTIRWLLINSEDVGDIGAMLSMAMSVGFGVTGVLLFMFTQENLRQYATLKAMGATPRLLLSMIFAQAGLCALIGTGLGLGLCAIIGEIAYSFAQYPFRMMWFTPLLGSLLVLLVAIVAAAISARPVIKLDPAVVFAGR